MLARPQKGRLPRWSQVHSVALSSSPLFAGCSTSGRGVCSPTVFSGREAAGGASGGIFNGVQKEDRQFGYEPRDGSCTASEHEAFSGMHHPGGQFPVPIRCTEVVTAIATAAGSGSDLAHFLHRSCHPVRNAWALQPRGDLWPCPPPRRWTADTSVSPNPRRRRRLRRVMNWLALGQCRSPPDYARAGFPVSAGREAMLSIIWVVVR